MKIHFKKILISFIVIAGFVFYGLYQHFISDQQNTAASSQSGTANTQIAADEPTSTETQNSSDPPDTTVNENNFEIDDDEEYGEEEDDEDFSVSQSSQQTASETTSASSSTNDTAANSSTDSAGSAATNASAGIYKDGQYEGDPADAHYGIVQVNAIIECGKLVDIQFLSYPDSRSYSVELNKYAMPILTAEAVKSQSANVDIVTGATMTTKAFIISLASALDQAKV
jgi:uncharacterized protein with FMN-binding domain